MKTYSAADANPAALKDKTIVVYGYGSQGRAHARNLHDSGFTVVVAARPGASYDQAKADGLAVDTPERAIPVADLIALLTPDMTQAQIYKDIIAPHARQGAALLFAHGFNVHFGQISARADPFNFLLGGRLSIELEVELSKYLSLELVPVFVVIKSPPMLNYATYEKSSLHQESNGWGPLAGAALDLGIWFAGKPLQGYVLRAGLTNYAYTYVTTPPANDTVSHTSRELYVLLGSHNRWSAITLAYAFGLGYELNQQNRCFDSFGNATSDCPKDQLLIKLDQTGSSVADLHGYLYPFDFLVRFSLGVVF